jgi:hypothetical protein
MTADPWQWLHDNGFSWDDVNAVAAIFEAGGFEVTPAPDSGAEERLRAALDVERLEVSQRTKAGRALLDWWKNDPKELALVDDVIAAICAIETEAAVRSTEALIRAVETMDESQDRLQWQAWRHAGCVPREVVLSAIRSTSGTTDQEP